MNQTVESLASEEAQDLTPGADQGNLTLSVEGAETPVVVSANGSVVTGTANETIGIVEQESFFSDTQSEEFGWGGYFQAMAAVFLLLGLLYLLVYLLKRMSGRGGFKLFKRGELELEGQLPLGPKRSVVVVRFLNKRMVLGVTDTHINLLHTMETGHDKDSKTFSQTLAEADPGSGVSGEEPREDNTVVETPATDPDDA